MRCFRYSIFLLVLLWAHSAWSAEPDWFVPAPGVSRNFVITRSLSGQILAHDGQIEVSLNGKTQKLADYDPQDLLDGKLFVTPEDFNFDGYADLNVFQSYGYAGVNIFSRVFLFDPTTMTFMPSIDGCNLQVDRTSQSVLGHMKSSPEIVNSEYKASDGKLYLARTDTTLDSCICAFETFNVSGQSTAEGLYECCQGHDIAIKPERVVKIEKAFLYAKPEETAKTKMYLIRSDAVRLLQTDGTHQWYFVEFKGKKTVNGWVKTSDLGSIPGSEGL